MSGKNGFLRFDRSALGNLAVGALLALIAIVFLDLQKGSLTWSDPGDERIVGAIGVLVVYFALCAMLFAQRRNTKLKTQALELTVDDHVTSKEKSVVLVVFASQTGFAEQIATQTALSLRNSGQVVMLCSIGDLDQSALERAQHSLFVVSTTGEGDPPDSAMRLMQDASKAEFSLKGLRYGVLALGDSEYVNYCAFGHHMDQWLRERGASAMFDVIEVDNGDEGALRNWQHQLGLLAGNPDLADWQSPTYAKWRLVERRHLNSGSAGDPCFHLALVPMQATDLCWTAGDIVEIGPRNSAQDVAAFLANAGFSGDEKIDVGLGVESLSELVARCHLPESLNLHDATVESFGAGLKPLPHREYSIASIPADGELNLLVRQMHRADGRLGLGSGWLGTHARLGGEISMRVRANSNFHLPGDARPIIFIGNGTGLAGLRALLKQRVTNGQFRNWLIFGERNAAHDFYYRDELEAWRADGRLEHLDLAFSRDQSARFYVQDRLRVEADRLRAWIADGASIYVCGSLEGMAPGVDAVLRAVLGVDDVDSLVRDQRYRRDVY